jgi:F0F1-type ATP synthase membrane subunit b/b'
MAETRSDEIKGALDEAAKLRKQAAAKLDEYNSKLAASEAEMDALLKGMRADAEADKARILANAEKQAAATKRDAELRIAAEIERARAELAREVALAAATAAEKLLREKINATDQARWSTASSATSRPRRSADQGSPLMQAGSLARRYARALMDLASKAGNVDKVASELRDLAGAYKTSPELGEVLGNASYPKAKRRAIVDALLTKLSAQPLTKTFCNLLLDNERLATIPDIARELDAMVEARAGRSPPRSCRPRR